jgi:hypothetical protein
MMIVLGLLTTLLFIVMVAGGGAARAAEGPMGDPGDVGIWDRIKGTVSNECLAGPPEVQSPRGEGFPTPFVQVPETIAGGAQGQWQEYGFAGLKSFTYDMGCTITNGPSQVQAAFNTGTANDLVGLAHFLTAVADFMDKASWDPRWITAFFTDLASTLVEAFRLAAFLPYAAIGLIFTVIMLLWRSRKGQVSTVALGTAWAATVIVVATLIMSSPLLLPSLVQNQSGGMVSALYNGEDPSEAATTRTVEAIHEQGALRRMFGTDPSPAAVAAFPTILRSTSWSWVEYKAIQADPASKQAMWEAKMDALNEVTADLKEADPQAYQKMTGLEQDRIDPAALELGYSAVTNLFRIAAAFLRVLCIVAIFIIGLAWLFAAPFIVTPQGENTGRGLLNNTLRAVGYCIISILGSYGFTTWAAFAMAPDLTEGLSLILLLIGTVVFWSLIRPDRKILSLATAGKVQGFGGLTKFLIDKISTAAAVGVGAKVGTEAGTTTSKTSGAKPTSSEEYDPPVYEGVVIDEPRPVYQRGAGLPSTPTVIDGEAWEVRPTAGALDAEPSKVDDVSVPHSEVRYEVEVYQRPLVDQ